MKTLIVGASKKPDRYSFMAAEKLKKYGHEIVQFSKKADIDILNSLDGVLGIDTVTMYINPSLQSQYFDDILELKPRRVIFNPGTENPTFEKLLKDQNIMSIEGCTLVMLQTGQY